MKTLEERIIEAHKSGNNRVLERLQAEYRSTRSITRITGPMEFVAGSRPRPTPSSPSRAGLPELRASGPKFNAHLSFGTRSAIEEEVRDYAGAPAAGSR